MRRWIIALILIPAAAYGAAKLTVWYTVKDGFATVQESMAPFASVEHSKILSPVFSAFGVTGVRIKPHILEDEINIGSALLHIEDPIEKYQFLSARLNGTIPTSFKFSLNGVRVPLNDDVATWFNTAAAPAGSSSGPSAACSTGTGFTLGNIRKMGYQELVANVMADYAYDRRGGGLNTYLKLQVREMFEMTVEGRIPPADVVFAYDRMTAVPKLSDLTLTLHDLSWSPRFNRYCADILGISEAQYVEKRVNDAREAFMAAGFEPSTELLAGLKQFAQGTASLTLSLNPRDPFDPTRLQMEGDPEYMIDKLGIEVMVEGNPIRNLGAVSEVAVEETERKEEQFNETYKPTPLEQLPQFLKSSVQIFTTDGKVHEGYLDSVDSRTIVLTRHLVGGSATFDVGREEVEKILVLRP